MGRGVGGEGRFGYAQVQSDAKDQARQERWSKWLSHSKVSNGGHLSSSTVQPLTLSQGG
jgi:hypothetical protein